MFPSPARVAIRYIRASGTVSVIVDVPATLAARAKYSLFTEIVVGKFDQPIALYRAFDGEELRKILASGKITGGTYSVRAEREFGASWGSDISAVINFGNRDRGHRLGNKIYLAKIDGFDFRFANLNPKVAFDPNGPDKQEVQMPTNSCNVGLGCSVVDVSISDVDAFYEVFPNDQIERRTIEELRNAVEEMDASVPQTPTVVPKAPAPAPVTDPTLGLQPKDKFVVVQGSNQMGVTKGQPGVVQKVELQARNRVVVWLWFPYPLRDPPMDPKTPPRGRSQERHAVTLYTVHRNRLDEPLITLQDGSGRKIVIRRRP